MWEIFSFGERPYNEYQIKNSASFKKLLMNKKIMSHPKKYLHVQGDEKDHYVDIKNIYTNIITK